MKLEVGRKYRDSEGNILCVVSTDFKVRGDENLAVVIYENLGNYPSVHTLNGKRTQLGSFFLNNIIECLGVSQLPIFKNVHNYQGEEIDYLINYGSEDNTHLGIVHTSCGDGIRCFFEDGKIVTPMKFDNELKESIPNELLNI